MKKRSKSLFKRLYFFWCSLPPYPALFIAMILLLISLWAIVGYTAAILTVITVQTLALVHDFHYQRFVEKQKEFEHELYRLLDD